MTRLCACSGGRVGPCFVVFAEEFRRAGPKENSSLLEWGAFSPGAEVTFTKSAGEAEDGRMGEGGREGTV